MKSGLIFIALMFLTVGASAEKPRECTTETVALVMELATMLPQSELYGWEIAVLGFHEETKQAYLVMSPRPGDVKLARATFGKDCLMKPGTTKNYAMDPKGMMEEIVSSGARRHTDGIVRGARILSNARDHHGLVLEKD